ncbi:interleukin-2 receptor subunit beta-like [Anguilla rostrata]|uniref:interleukin-2 receptor subunit beta-like n=1 Tax=Anguilla rostrata TaxID=7938 RepID=UPI0030D10719
MGVPWLSSLFLLLAVQILPGHSRQGLTCTNDYINNITCMWNSSGSHPGVHCVLQGELERHNKHVNSCDLKPMEGQDTLRSCHLIFNKEEGFNSRDKLPLTVTCENDTVVRCDYRPKLHIKMHPPGKPIVAKSNVSWSLSKLPKMPLSFYCELQYKRSEQPWENAVSRNLTAKQMSVELPEDKLEKGRQYEARVRVMPSEPKKGVWSSWSPTASWRSEVGRIPKTPSPSVSFPGLGPELQVTLGLVTAAVALLVLITCKFHRAGWVYNLKLQHVPNPSTYFQSLNSVHGGNFQKWLSPRFAPESFDVPQSFEDISAVEVFKAKDVTTLFYSKHASDPREKCDSSSKPPSSYSVEVCPVYSGYKSGVVHSGEEVGGEGVELENTPLQVSYCEVRQLDPGCMEQNEKEEEEEEEEGEIENGPKVMDTLPPLTILPFTLLVPATPSLIPLPPHLPSTPLLPFPFHDFDSNIAPGSSNTSGPLEGALGRSPFAELEPSSGDYMSVQSARCNNSL